MSGSPALGSESAVPHDPPRPGAPSGSAGTHVRVSDVRHVYRGHGPGGVLALDGVSLNITNGAFVSLIGPSGCGKSTLLKVIGGLVSPVEGAVQLDGTSIEGPTSETGFMFQEATLLPWRTALANVLLPIEIRHGKVAAKRSRRRAQELLQLTGLGEFASSYPQGLSGGMAQRVAVCRMLISGPSLLLLDEPFGALDELTRESMNVELQEICHRESATAIMVTHSIPEAVFMSDVVYVMSPRPGRISHQIAIDLPRPRTVELMASVEFARLVGVVRAALTGRPTASRDHGTGGREA